MSKYVLWLAGWYPSAVSPSNGDFIERHAKAVSRHIPVKLIHVVRDLTLAAGEIKIEKMTVRGLSAHIAYYNVKPGIFEKFLSRKAYIRLHKKLFEEIRQQEGVPALVHVHIAFKAGLFALRLKRKWRIPYVLSEHWSGYYKENREYCIYNTPLQLRLTKKILDGAKYLLPVSESLGEAISHLSTTPRVVIPNVVDTALFRYRFAEKQEPVFVHISNMAPVKNAEGILRAVAKLYEGGLKCKLIMIGAKPASLLNLARSLGALENYVFFPGSISHERVPEVLGRATALLVFSDYETQSCVALEALCCGVPVIATAVGGLPEVVDQSNGILVDRGDEEQLVEAMKKIAAAEYDREQMANAAFDKYSYDRVGLQIMEIYKQSGLR